MSVFNDKEGDPNIQIVARNQSGTIIGSSTVVGANTQATVSTSGIWEARIIGTTSAGLGVDDFSATIDDISSVPTLNEWGVVFLLAGLVGASFLKLRKMNLGEQTA